MGLLTNIFKSKVLGGNTPDQEQFRDEMYMDLYPPAGGGYTGGQGLPPVMQPVLPPTLEKETMDLYLKVKVPDEPENLKGIKRYWVFTDNDAATHLITSNLDAKGQREILSDLQTATDLDGCDNVEGLLQDIMLRIHGKVQTDKSRSDYSDRLRERIVPAVGISMFGQHGGSSNADRVERPKENRSVFGIFNSGRG